VLADGRLLRRRQTGVATYIRELRNEMGAAPAGGLEVEWSLGLPSLPRRNRLTSVGNLALELLWLHVWLPLLAWRRGAALVHAPMNWAPRWCPCPVVVTVQDLSFERLPGAYPAGFRLYARLFARASARRARLVIVSSEATARDVEELYGVPRERIRIVPLGVHHDPDPSPGARREPFVLSVGVLDARKRIAALVEGHHRYLQAAPPEPPPCRLIVVGGGGGDEEAVRRAVREGCEIAGFVPPERLTELYRLATLLVYPSAHEGFGLPVVEAMAHGCPVLVARNSSLVEVGGDVALYLDDATPDGIAAALADALADREALRVRGEASRAHAARYSWARTTEETMAVYREAIGA
jgi:glycosyltransferase involved in cell wall biosynthesis